MKTKININIDKLRVCYNQPQELMADIIQRSVDDWVDYGEFVLRIIHREYVGETLRCMKTLVLLKGAEEGKEYTLLGEFTFYNTSKYDGRCFFAAENSALYCICGKDYYGNNLNLLGTLPYITETLGLEFNNFTEIEIAADVNFNAPKVILDFIKKHDEWDMIQNGRKISNENKHLPNFSEVYGRSRRKRDRHPTINIKQYSKGIPLQLRCYDKTKELIEETPYKREYIESWNDFGKEKIYRVEITLANDDYRQWQSFLKLKQGAYPSEWTDPMNQISLLMLEKYRYALWAFCVHRLLYFHKKHDKKYINLGDILLGERP